ncbi:MULTISPECIES: peptidoglycan editing factor PgeF [unclassified Acidovorax]|uniref:peptidoglycan editing factor PgeF n=1 Tax=unclassified Acidovorax TaxID=2684926 RepID=UPI000B3FE59A|nr:MULTISPECIES: peptidoglycan editing factor PgeF [unclassified Acidovorax]MBP3981450.1 peptidoglycan editing factor PgeF [Acidovorax sp. JG5]
MNQPPGIGHVDWLQPQWPAPAGVHALCTTRAGGVSSGPYTSLNLGSHVGDAPGAVLANRQRLQAAVQGASPGARAVFLNQVHGTVVADIDPATPDGTEADACVATQPGAVCTIMVADCLPVLLAHGSGAMVGAAHAGWRGLAGMDGTGVLEAVFERFKALAHTDKALAAIKNESTETIAAHTMAWLGPCIGPTAFEVGAEVREAFCQHHPAAQACFVPQGQGKFLTDLAGLARLRLRALGVTQIFGNDSTAPWCTVGNASRFFSYRRDQRVLGGSGRMAACIWRDASSS